MKHKFNSGKPIYTGCFLVQVRTNIQFIYAVYVSTYLQLYTSTEKGFSVEYSNHVTSEVQSKKNRPFFLNENTVIVKNNET